MATPELIERDDAAQLVTMEFVPFAAELYVAYNGIWPAIHALRRGEADFPKKTRHKAVTYKQMRRYVAALHPERRLAPIIRTIDSDTSKYLTDDGYFYHLPDSDPENELYSLVYRDWRTDRVDSKRMKYSPNIPLKVVEGWGSVWTTIENHREALGMRWPDGAAYLKEIDEGVRFFRETGTPPWAREG